MKKELKNLKYIDNENRLIQDYGKSMKFNKYYLSYCDYSDENDEMHDSIAFNTEKELIDYLLKHGIE